MSSTSQHHFSNIRPATNGEILVVAVSATPDTLDLSSIATGGRMLTMVCDQVLYHAMHLASATPATPDETSESGSDRVAMLPANTMTDFFCHQQNTLLSFKAGGAGYLRVWVSSTSPGET